MTKMQIALPCQVITGKVEGSCGRREGGGRLCENPKPGHAIWECAFSDHTPLHERMGNGYTCEAIEVMLKDRKQ